jgi:hypothetical protein
MGWWWNIIENTRDRNSRSRRVATGKMWDRWTYSKFNILQNVLGMV